ncbi:hypothetical protein ONS95_007430 [Cadophora gregata]|uniref:uncharacterized protein n=1 Tax=Cadophora gregata TaxID=51156 RepID=UPI0026DC9D30|nr:uncharacterized protein ONS95_007430 [Cadophora gregata]KAK0118542.1 hypothetical protein ONS96_011636 [Cadophora gregata f. sp. sojae]KAK0125798.1 hypothetical protein ONS95_007430 [Cadophora gregata]
MAETSNSNSKSNSNSRETGKIVDENTKNGESTFKSTSNATSLATASEEKKTRNPDSDSKFTVPASQNDVKSEDKNEQQEREESTKEGEGTTPQDSDNEGKQSKRHSIGCFGFRDGDGEKDGDVGAWFSHRFF